MGRLVFGFGVSVLRRIGGDYGLGALSEDVPGVKYILAGKTPVNNFAGHIRENGHGEALV